MSEQLPNDESLDSKLTPEQLALLDAGPGQVKHPARLATLYEVEARAREMGREAKLNNFCIYFDQEYAGISSSAMRTYPCYQRFLIVYPELNERIEAAVRGQGYQANFTVSDVLDEAYVAMSRLVDINDPYVIEGDKVNAYYLTI